MHKTSLFRAYCDWPYETAVFVEAGDRLSASFKISLLIGALYGCQPDDVSFYNLDSYLELIEEKGIDDDRDFRLFESGWNSDGVTSWVDSPLFLAPLNQSFLLAAWGRLQCHLEDLGHSDQHQQVRPRM
jgi:hypothetical protein